MFIALSPVQDLFLQGTALRGIGGYPSLFPLLAILAVSLTRRLCLGNFNVNRILLLCLAYVIATTFYGFVVFGTTVFGESLFLKSATNAAPMIFFLFAMYGVDYEPQSTVRAALFTALGILVVGILFSDGNPFGLPSVFENSILHFGPAYGDRPRGLSTEPSELSITVIGIGFLCAHASRSRAAKRFLCMMTLGLLVLSGSKGGIMIIFLCVFILCLMKWHSKWYHVPAVVLVLVPLGIVAVLVSQDLFPQEQFSGGSVAMRVPMYLCALIAVKHHPLGVGLSGYLPAIATYLPEAMETMQSWIPVPVNFIGIAGNLSSTDKAGTMVFSLDQLIRFGIPFAVVFVVFVTRFLRRLEARKQMILFIGVLASAVAATTYIPMIGQFVTPILLGIALREAEGGADIRKRGMIS